MKLSISVLTLSALVTSQPVLAFGRGPDNPDDGFAVIDVNKDGVLSNAEFMEHGPNPPFVSTAKIFEKTDLDGDGKITKQEFVDAWHAQRGVPGD